MKSLKILFFLLFGFNTYSQIVNIPDANFKAKLLAASPSNGIASTDTPDELGDVFIFHKIDTNNDGEIQLSEALAVKWLNISDSNISSLNGIEHFNQLIVLDCGMNQLVDINVSNLTNLSRLYCNSNLLTSLNVSALTNLISLSCNNNLLTNINFAATNSYWLLDCSYNNLNELNLSNFNSLGKLICNNNQITQLDFTNIFNISELLCQNNFLTTLNVNDRKYLTELNCSNNLLTTLFIKTGLETLYSNGSEYLIFNNNPNLTYICCQDNDNIINWINNLITSWGLTNCHVNTYCSFTPNGNYNTIRGRVAFESQNTSCNQNSQSLKNIKVRINYTQNYYTFTNDQGIYNRYVLNGDYGIQPILENPSFFNVSPSSHTQSFFQIEDNEVTNNPFCLTPNGVNNDLEIVLAPHGNILPNSIAKFDLICKNKGNTTLTPQVFLSFSNDHLSFSSTNAVSYTSAPGLLDFDLDPLQPFETKVIEVVFDVFGPADVPPVNVGDNLTFTATINPVVNDQTPADNTFVLQEVVTNAQPPLSITCLEGDSLPVTNINDYLHYRINFANTSQEVVENVVVKTVLDPSLFDVSSLQLLHASAPIYVRINQNTVEYIFENINLAAASGGGGGGGHGHVIIKIKPKNSLEAGDSVMQQANIFYDYNAPLPTNVAETVFQNLSIQDNFNPNDFNIYPNPVKEELNIKTTEDIKKVEIFDTNGRLIQLFIQDKNQNSYDVSKLPSGLYFVRISTDDKIATLKIMKEAP